MEIDHLSGRPVPKPADEIIEKMRIVREDKTDDGAVLQRHYELDGDGYINYLTDGSWRFVPKSEVD